MGSVEGNANIKDRCYYFSTKLIKFLKGLEYRGIFRPVIDQSLRSGTSIAANVIEAKSASSRKDFTNFYQIALKSANETKYWLSLLKDTAEVNKDGIESLIKETDELTNILAASVLTLKTKIKIG